MIFASLHFLAGHSFPRYYVIYKIAMLKYINRVCGCERHSDTLCRLLEWIWQRLLFCALQLCSLSLGLAQNLFLPGDLKQIYIKVTVTNHFANISYPITCVEGDSDVRGPKSPTRHQQKLQVWDKTGIKLCEYSYGTFIPDSRVVLSFYCIRLRIRNCYSANFILCVCSFCYFYFSFTYSINKSFGIYLESVNGLAGSTEKHTHWELLLKKDNSRTRLNVG